MNDSYDYDENHPGPRGHGHGHDGRGHHGPGGHHGHHGEGCGERPGEHGGGRRTRRGPGGPGFGGKGFPGKAFPGPGGDFAAAWPGLAGFPGFDEALAGPGGPGGRHGGHGHRRRGGRARRGDVRAAALFLLAEEPMNGYQIIQTLTERTGQMWRPSPGSIYPVLAQLEDTGLIEPCEREGRKAFQLTRAGREEVEAAGDRPRPWEFSTGEDEPGADSPARALRAEYAQVTMALKAITHSGDDDLVAAAAEALGQMRRSLYLLLAGQAAGTRPSGQDEPGDGAAPDATPGRS